MGSPRWRALLAWHCRVYGGPPVWWRWRRRPAASDEAYSGDWGQGL